MSAPLSSSEWNFNKWSQSFLSRYYGALVWVSSLALWKLPQAESARLIQGYNFYYLIKGNIFTILRLTRTPNKLLGTLQLLLTPEEGKRPEDKGTTDPQLQRVWKTRCQMSPLTLPRRWSLPTQGRQEPSSHSFSPGPMCRRDCWLKAWTLWRKLEMSSVRHQRKAFNNKKKSRNFSGQSLCSGPAEEPVRGGIR